MFFLHCVFYCVSLSHHWWQISGCICHICVVFHQCVSSECVLQGYCFDQKISHIHCICMSFHQCVFGCVLQGYSSEQKISHIQCINLYGFPPVCIRLCPSRVRFWAKDFWHAEFPRLDAWASISRLCVAYQASKRAEASFWRRRLHWTEVPQPWRGENIFLKCYSYSIHTSKLYCV